jgi:hypothetical protein
VIEYYPVLVSNVVDPGVEDLDVRGVLDVDAVGVWAERRRADEEAVDAHALAVVELEVELWAVLDAQVAHRHVIAQEEPDELQPEADRSS